MDHVYVAPTFSLPEEESTLTSDGELQPMTNNATTMIGADVVNETGFTGKGMKVAILDTGIVVDHPNFGALSEDKLTESSLDEGRRRCHLEHAECGPDDEPAQSLPLL